MNRERFVDLWRRVVDSDHDEAEAIFNRLYSYYDSIERHYHSAEHIIFCLEQFDKVRDDLDDPDAVELALWFHDVIYECGAQDNELQSSEYFSECSCKRLSELYNGKVRQLIMDTTHKAPPKSHDGRFIVDIDLSSIALPWPEFLHDTMNVRAESPLCDSEYYQRQLAFFSVLLKRPHFFYTDYFEKRYGKQAKYNLERFIREVKQGKLNLQAQTAP
ncbi:HD domain-containing protein [Zooshikella harenae]|uniref:N-methyl-D-aspartate receptor NMDAR2C subunit n=1 Tax=Zooshikella harenae TaxID=2827238 RepID=A0ABS5ZG59_9GAMM|nr:hypothetical protein [Zooshikella harenae]MBU2713034.1 hypothetical protein [Zooshikella harenae]